MRFGKGPDLLVVVLATGATLVLAWLHLTGRVDLRPYLGPAVPLVLAALPLAAVAGVELLGRRAGIAVWPSAGRLRWAIIATAAATVFVIPPVMFDGWVGFGEISNVPLPEAILFYPAMAFAATTFFHVLPLTLLAVWTPKPYADVSGADLVRLLPVALIEPAYQAAFQVGMTGWSAAVWFVAVHVFLFNLCQLWLLAGSGFLPAYLFRLAYYAWWHVAWGAMRLDL